MSKYYLWDQTALSKKSSFDIFYSIYYIYYDLMILAFFQTKGYDDSIQTLYKIFFKVHSLCKIY